MKKNNVEYEDFLQLSDHDIQTYHRENGINLQSTMSLRNSHCAMRFIVNH